MDQIVERYNGYVGISGSWMISLLGKDIYDKSLQRGHIRSLRRGGNGRTALVDWQSMSGGMKGRIMDAMGGDPMVMVRRSLLKKILNERDAQLLNGESYEYYSHVRSKDGSYLNPEKVTELWNGAKIMDAITELLKQKKTAASMGRMKMSESREFDALSREVEELAGDGYKNGLPTSADRLRKKYKDYMLHGYEVLIHGLTGRESNHTQRSAEERAVVTSLVAHGSKMNDVQVSKVAGTMGIEIDRRRVQEIRTDNEMNVMCDREGRNIYRNNMMMQVDRVRPDMPLKMLSVDGWDVELYYRDEKSYYNRLNVVMVTDVMNDYVLGYAIGDHECKDLICSAFRDAVHHTRDLFGGYYGYWQVQSDNYGRGAMTPYYQSLCKYYTPAAVGNAKSKPIEQMFRTVESNYLWVLSNNSGHNITSKSQGNDDYTNSKKKEFPDREGCIAQIEKIIQIDRSQKIGEMRAAWEQGPEEMRRPLDMELYLRTFGDIGRGNMLTANGLRLIRHGKEYKFDSFDIEMRKHRGERWNLCYDLNDMNQALAVSEDGRWRYMIEAKKKVPMALVDYKEEDWQALAEYREYNAKLKEHTEKNLGEARKLADEYVAKRQLEGDFSARLLTEKGGNHKDAKKKQREKRTQEVGMIDTALCEMIEDVHKKETKERRAEDIWDRYFE